MKNNRSARLREEAAKRILVLDGAMGTMLQTFHLEEADFRGELFRNHSVNLKGDNDVLNLTRPDAVRAVHRLYLEAGADIIETNTFNSNAVSQKEYVLADFVYRMARAGAENACAEAESFTARNPMKPRFVAASIGPTSRTLSMSPDVSDPGRRELTFSELVDAYRPALQGVIDGGADILLIETIFDTLNAKAAARAAEEVFSERGKRLPMMFSGTVSDASGRLLAGQNAEAFLISILHAPELLSVGFNCALGAAEMRPHLVELAQNCPVLVSAHPNAGLPDSEGRYVQTPERMGELIGEFARSGLLNIAGGCCGTNPDFIRAIARAVEGVPPRKIPAIPRKLRLAGLDPMCRNDELPFINVGERTNVAGSKKFLRLMKECKWDEALRIARDQVENGAKILDVNMDDALLDSEQCMRTFLLRLAAEPDIARVPLMIDSSRWNVIRAGLQCAQGKCVVNSISLKEGEGPFLEKAREARSYGAAVLAMAFDEQGQADTVERRVAVCRRMFSLLTEKAGFPPEDIIFDPNVFAVATGMSEHDNYAKDFIEAVRRIRAEMPYCSISGGISNVSFSFRGNESVRRALHSVFLYHAIRAGLDMGIVNPAQLDIYDSIEPGLRAAAEVVILNSEPGAAEKLLALAAGLQTESAGEPLKNHVPAWRSEPLEKRLSEAMVRGDDAYLESDLAEALRIFPKAVDIIEGPLMEGMRRAGVLFGEGKMFLPQVVKTARTMKRAVEILTPHLESAGAGASAGTVVLATVKGDVHDIGKNIVAVVLRCNGYRVVDLGVMTPAETILAAAEREKASAVCLSGLITPSLAEMAHVASEMERAKMTIPLFVGGATTSKEHTALHIQTEYSSPCVHTRDASQIAPLLNVLLNPAKRDAYFAGLRREYAEISASHSSGRTVPELPLSERRSRAAKIACASPAPAFPGVRTVEESVSGLLPFIHWNEYYHAWSVRGSAGEKTKDMLYRDALRMLETAAPHLNARAVFGIFPARKENETVFVNEEKFEFPRARVPEPDGTYPSLADFLQPEDFLGMFALRVSGADTLADEYTRAGDDYSALAVKLLSDRLAEAFALKLHSVIRRKYWGCDPSETLSPAELISGKNRGIRAAPGYPACPDHTLKRGIFRILDAEKQIGIRLTETDMMIPVSSVTAFLFAARESHYFNA